MEKYWKLFCSALKLSACTFGGGFVIIALMRRKFVEELKWIEETEMLDLAAIAQSSPGAIAVNAFILVGYRVAGVFGAWLTVLGTILPPLVIISVVSLFYQQFRDNLLVNRVMAGMLAGVTAVIFDVVFQMIKDLLKGKRLLPLVVLAVSFMAVHFFGVNILVLFLVCAIIGVADSRHTERSRK